MIGIWTAIKYVTKETARNAFILYVLLWIAVIPIQTPIFQFASMFSLKQVQKFLFVTVLACAVLYPICQFFSLHKIFLFIKDILSHLSLILVVICLFFISLALVSLRSNEEQIWILTVLFIVSSILIYAFTRSALEHERKSQKQMHDVGNLLEGIEFLVNSTKNREEIKKDYESTLKHLGFEIPTDSSTPKKKKKIS